MTLKTWVLPGSSKPKPIVDSGNQVDARLLVAHALFDVRIEQILYAPEDREALGREMQRSASYDETIASSCGVAPRYDR
jgi:hypothetical protein